MSFFCDGQGDLSRIRIYALQQDEEKYVFFILEILIYEARANARLLCNIPYSRRVVTVLSKPFQSSGHDLSLPPLNEIEIFDLVTDDLIGVRILHQIRHYIGRASCGE